MSDETRILTYADLAAARGITVHAARNLARGKRWHKTTGNDGKVRLHVPLEMIPEAPSQGPVEAPPPAPPQAPSQAALDLLAEHITKLQGELEPLRSLPAQVAALQAALEATREERDRLLTREHARESRRWWRRLAG